MYNVGRVLVINTSPASLPTSCRVTCSWRLRLATGTGDHARACMGFPKLTTVKRRKLDLKATSESGSSHFSFKQ